MQVVCELDLIETTYFLDALQVFALVFTRLLRSHKKLLEFHELFIACNKSLI